MTTKLSAYDDDNGKPVDWWFMYKLPDDVGKPKTKGYEYLYYDPNSADVTMSKKDLDTATDDSALEATLKAIFDPDKASASWILYNDEMPIGKGDDGSKGHCKGVLAFDKGSDSGVLLIHSTPRFPDKGEITLPEDERIYGQTYLAITLKDYATANALAEQLRTQQDPQVYDHQLSKDITAAEAVSKFANGKTAPKPKKPNDIDIVSADGMKFKIIAKNAAWGGDFWVDLVAPTLGVDMQVETWRRGTVPPEEKTSDPDEIGDIQYIDLAALGHDGFDWKYTKDHAKWGVSENAKKPWVCVGDINRMVSQEKRSGGTAAFLEPKLWKALSSIELLKAPK